VVLLFRLKRLSLRTDTKMAERHWFGLRWRTARLITVISAVFFSYE
jgi:hypothetical protein